MLKNYLLITWRSMMKNKLFIFINVFGMGIAIACCIVAYLNRDFNESFDKQHVNAQTIYRVHFWHDFQGRLNRYAMVPKPLAGHIKQNLKDVDHVVRFQPGGSNIRIGDELFNVRISYADSAFFDLFTFNFKYGNVQDFHDKSKVFISDELARKLFNTEDAVGKQITQINNGEPKEFTVGAVFSKPPMNSSFSFEAISLMENYWTTSTDPEETENNWKRWNTTFVQIKNPSRISSITQQLQQYVAPQNKVREDFKVKEYYLENFEGMAKRSRNAPELNGNWLRNSMPTPAVLAPGIMAALLLLLACFNFTNTSIAISSRRLKEIGIRKVMGSMRKQLVLQFLGENLLLCFLALVVGLLLAELLVPAYDNMWVWLELDLNYTENAGFLIFLVSLLFTTGLIAGSYPAFYISGFEPVSILKGKARFGGTNWMTRTLLGFQFVISLIGIVCGIGFIKNAEYQKEYDLGYMTDGVISAWISNEGEFNTLRDAIASNKDIKVIAGTKNHVGNWVYNDPVKFESTEREVDIMDIGDGYMEAMGMTLLSGRAFKKDSETDKKESVLVSEKFVKEFGWSGDPVGKRLVWMDTVQLYVIGVVKDIYTSALWDEVEPVMLRYVGPDKYSQLIVSTAPENTVDVNKFMEAEWKKIFPNTLYNGEYVNESMQETNEINDNVIKMFSFLGVIAALMSVTGLFTLVSLNIVKKMKEIGVRKVLGASLFNITQVINMEFIIILAVASVLGCAAGYFLTDMLMGSIWKYYLKMGWTLLGLSAFIMFILAACTVSIKTIKTAGVNPVNTLRDE